MSYDKLHSNFRAFTVRLDHEKLPVIIKQAFSDPKWKRAVIDEMDALLRNNTWELVPKECSTNPVGCKWVFAIKYNSDGSINRYKARLVAKGFTQEYGVDYVETFAPVAKLNTVRIIFSIAVNLDWKLFQLDTKNAFLNGELKESVFMDIPPGYKTEQNKSMICKLKKSIYGLKQSPRAWFARFTKVVLKYGFKQAHSDHTLFINRKNSLITVLLVYVDDIILTGNDDTGILRIKKQLAS